MWKNKSSALRNETLIINVPHKYKQRDDLKLIIIIMTHIFYKYFYKSIRTKNKENIRTFKLEALETL